MSDADLKKKEDMIHYEKPGITIEMKESEKSPPGGRGGNF